MVVSGARGSGRQAEVYYLDTSALVKRYVEEQGTETVDGIFLDAYKGLKRIALSYWNIGEAAVVFDKYERLAGLDARQLLRRMLRELRTLTRLGGATLVGVSPRILRSAVAIVLRRHVYVADALQIVSAREAGGDVLVTGDKRLAEVAEAEGLHALLL